MSLRICTFSVVFDSIHVESFVLPTLMSRHAYHLGSHSSAVANCDNHTGFVAGGCK